MSSVNRSHVDSMWQGHHVLVFGCCVGPSGKFTSVALPGLESVMHVDDLLIEEQGSDGICAAYNRILDHARSLPDCEGVVLLHDDVALGPDARQQLMAGLRQPGVGVVGAVGGRGLFGPQWVNARHRAGYANDYYGWRRYGRAVADVDVVDGLLLALAPAAFRSIDFDSKAFPAFHGYDTDYCLLARAAGHRVRVVYVEYTHRDKGGLGDSSAFDVSKQALIHRWPDRIRPLSPLMRQWHPARDSARAAIGKLRHRVATRFKSTTRRH